MVEFKNHEHYNQNDELLDTPYSRTIRNRMSRCVNIAKSLFSKGVTSNGRTFNCTFAFNKSKLLAIGINNYNKQIQYLKQFKTNYCVYCGENYHPSLHDEISCLLKLGLEDCSHIDFYSVRINKWKKCCCSRPCLNCENILNQVGFKHVWYFDKDMKMRSL